MTKSNWRNNGWRYVSTVVNSIFGSAKQKFDFILLFIYDSDSGWIESGLYVYEVHNNVKNRRMFRTIARDICGESMEPKDSNLVLFGEIKTGFV